MDISTSVVGPFLINSFGDRYLYDVNGSVFDKVGADVVFQKHFGESLFEENTLYIIIGSDSGLLPQYVAQKGFPEGSYYIFIEPPAVLPQIKSLSSIPSHEKIFITTAGEWLKCAEEIGYKNFIYLGNLQFVPSFAAMDGRFCDYFELLVQIQEELEKIKWSTNAELGAEVFNLRQLENIAENRVSATHLKGMFPGKTAIVLGGGPSLDEVLPWVIENRNSLFVIAVSRISKRLLDVHLAPDLVVSVDPNQISFDVSKEMLKLWKSTIFINQYHVVSTLLGQWCGRSLFFGARVPWDSLLNENIMTAPGPTVTNSAIDLSIQMGFAQVLLAGVDLCHSRDGYTHAQGSNERQAGPQLGQGRLWIETNGGWLAETTPDFHFAAVQIGGQATVAKQGHCQIINLSENSARMEGVRYCQPADVVLEKLQKSGFDAIVEILPVDTSEARSDYYREALAEIVRSQNAFREIKRLSNEALKANALFFGRQGKDKGNRKYRIKMDRIEKKLKNGFSDFSLLVKQIGIRDFLKMTQGDQGRTWDEDDAEKLGRIYYEAYRDSADRLLKIVDSAATRLKSRLEEENPQPDFSKLILQWQQDRQPGRAIVWKVVHPHGCVPEKFLEQFQRLTNEFEEILTSEETAHLKRARTYSQLGQVRGKMQMMYRQRQVENLSHLVENLKSQEGDDTTALALLGEGYLAELTENIDEALSFYQQLIDLPDERRNIQILEETLKRLLSLSLKNYDSENARIVAECLAGISVTYLPHYAELLWLLGEQRTALDLYADYMEEVPDDHIVMIKLGKHYAEIGVTDGARLMFEAVLQKDSSNTSAKKLLAELGAD
jgi:tetratricopeptide (TPR) repeat protein